MKNKLCYILIIFISLFMFSGRVEASTATCEYTHDKFTVKVYYDFNKTPSYDEEITKAAGKVSLTINNNDINISGIITCPKLSVKTKPTGKKNSYEYVLTVDKENGSLIGILKDFVDDGAESSSASSNRKVCIYNEGKTDEYKAEYGSSGLVITLTGSSIKNLKWEYANNSGTFTEKDFEDKCPNIHMRCVHRGANVCYVSTTGYFGFSEDAPDFEGDVNTGEEKNDEEDKVVTNGETIKIVRRIYHIIKILIPVLIILLSVIDFLKVVIVDDEKNYKSAWDKFIKRLMIGVIFFIVPILVSFILNYSGIETEHTFLDIFK